MEKMFCFQCEQTAQSKGCTVQGVCGKTSDNLQTVHSSMNAIQNLLLKHYSQL